MLQGIDYLFTFKIIIIIHLRIQRAWRQYVAHRSNNCNHQSDSFEEQVYQATGLNVTNIITSSATLLSVTPDQPETELVDQYKSTSIVHSSDSNIQECIPETLVENTKESSPTLEVIKANSPPVEDASENIPVVEDTNVDSFANVETVEEIHQQEDATANDDVITQKGDRKVRFNLQSTEEKLDTEDSIVIQDSPRSLSTSGLIVPSTEENVTENSNTDVVSSNDDVNIMPAEKVKQLGYTQLRELKCSLENKLGCKLGHLLFWASLGPSQGILIRKLSCALIMSCNVYIFHSRICVYVCKLKPQILQ